MGIYCNGVGSTRSLEEEIGCDAIVNRFEESIGKQSKKHLCVKACTELRTSGDPGSWPCCLK